MTLHRSKPNARWWALAASSALLITALVAAVVYLVNRKPSVVDQVVILTVPSGAEIMLGGVSYGTSPVKLEKVKVGTYRLTISKENYDTIDTEVTISDSTPLDFRLKSAVPSELAGKSRDEQIKEFQALAEDFFARGRFANPGDDSAIRYVNLILEFDNENVYATAKREEIRRALLKNAQSEMNRGALGSAKDYYSQLREHFADDPEVAAGLNRLEALLSSKKGEVSNLVRKAEAALRAGRLVEPSRSSAYYYAREVLAIDNQNPQALAINNRIRERLLAVAEQYRSRGDDEAEIRQLQLVRQYFPGDAEAGARLGELAARRTMDTTRTNTPASRRRDGLNKHTSGNWAGAVEDLEYAIENGEQESTEVLFALGNSHKELGNYNSALEYFSRIPPVMSDQYNSARALMGDIEARRENWNRAIRFYEEARERGGSPRYSVEALNDRIESVERRLRAKAEEPTPVTIRVKHPHTFGSCKGELTVNATGVLYRPDSGDDDFSSTFVGAGSSVRGNKITLTIQGSKKTFEGTPGDLERFRAALTKYQTAAK